MKHPVRVKDNFNEKFGRLVEEVTDNPSNSLKEMPSTDTHTELSSTHVQTTSIIHSQKVQTTINNCFKQQTKFLPTDKRAKKITNLIAKMICLDKQPLKIVENEGFKALINFLEPRYNAI